MKITHFLIIASALVLPLISLAESVQVTEENIPFIYETKAEIPTPPKILAGMISEDYLRARDEFTARELFEKIEPVITKRIAAARETQLWRIEITDKLAEYDFDSKAFPTQLTEGTFIAFSVGNQRYAAKFVNPELFAKIPVELDVAKKLSGTLQKSRTVKILVEGVVKDAAEKNINYHKRKTINFEISKVVIKLADGMLVGEFSLQGKTNSGKDTDSSNRSNQTEAAPAMAKVDTVGEWTTGEGANKFSLCFWESGEARGEFEEKGVSIYLIGRWEVVKEPRWAGHVTFSGTVEYWIRNKENVTPKEEKFTFMFDPADAKLTYVRGGALTDKKGVKFHPSGVQANEDPVLHRQNNNRPIRMEPGNK